MSLPPVLPLEQLLGRVVLDPAGLPAFFRRLMKAPLWTLVYPHQAPTTMHQQVNSEELDWLWSPAGEAVWFTSHAQLHDAPGDLTPPGTPTPSPLEGTGYELLGYLYQQPANRRPIVLNYGSPLSLRLVPDQVQALLEGYFRVEGLEHFAQTGNPHTLRPVPRLAPQLMAALRTCCAKRPAVRAVYLAEWEWPDLARPRLLLAYEAPLPPAPALAGVLVGLLRKHYGPRTPVDVLALSLANPARPLNPIETYIHPALPVYERGS